MHSLVVPYRRWIWAKVLFATLLVKTAFGLQNIPGLIVEEFTGGSPGGKAGLQVGDRILSYDGKALASPAALEAAQENTFGKKEVVLEVRRGEQILRLNVPLGTLGVQVRPRLSSDVAKPYEEGRTALKVEGKKDEAITKWEAAAKTAQQGGDIPAAEWLYRRSGELQEDQVQWKEASEAYLAAWKLAQQSGDAAGQSKLLSALGRCSQKLNDFPGAEKWFEQARQVDLAAQNDLWVAGDLQSLGTLWRWRPRPCSPGG
jgi:tetratricopeptide (TPR) repeat protein